MDALARLSVMAQLALGLGVDQFWSAVRDPESGRP